jgi:hypothetical protein
MCITKQHKDDVGNSLNNVYLTKKGKYLYIMIFLIKLKKQNTSYLNSSVYQRIYLRF